MSWYLNPNADTKANNGLAMMPNNGKFVGLDSFGGLVSPFFQCLIIVQIYG
jgi:hypothetical protein